MKKITLLLVFLFSVQAFSTEKHALIIAIGDYPTKGGWSSISSKNDVPLIKNALLSQGFSEANITTLIDAQATKKGIVEAFEQMKSKIAEGDILVIHISAHGQQIPDLSGDEIDGLDEAIVAYDAWIKFNHNYKGENHFLDDEIGEFVTQYRNILGKNGQLLMIMDTCHSGTMTRSSGSSVRGSSTAFEIPNVEVKKGTNHSPSDLVEQVGVLKPNASPFVLISGASAEEENYEYKGYGSLSYAFSNVIAQIDNSQPKISYRHLFNDIKAQMNIIAKKQTPVIEGDIHFELFGKEKVEQQTYFDVVNVINPSEIVIQAGQIHGIFENATINVFPSNTLRATPERIISKGKVVSSKLNEAIIELDKPLPNRNKNEYAVFLDKKAFSDIQIDIFIDNEVGSDIKKELTNHIKENNLGTLVSDEKEADLVVFNDNNDLMIISSDGFELHKDNKSRGSQNIADIKQKISNYAQGQFLKGLKMQNDDYKIEFRYVPVKVDRSYKVTENLAFEDFVDASIFKVLPDEDYVQMEVKNVGKKPFYFNVLEINSKGEITPLIDFCENYQPNELRLEPGQTKQFCTINFAPPYEKLLIKAFATDTPLDFSSLVTSRGDTRSAKNPLERFLANSYQTTRGPKVVQERPEIDGYTTEFIYEIVEEK